MVLTAKVQRCCRSVNFDRQQSHKVIATLTTFADLFAKQLQFTYHDIILQYTHIYANLLLLSE